MQTNLPFTMGLGSDPGPGRGPSDSAGPRPDRSAPERTGSTPAGDPPPPPPSSSSAQSGPSGTSSTSGAGAAAKEGAARLSAELRAAVVRELLRSWHFINGSHFRSALLPPTLGLHAGEHRLGFWQGATRTLSLAEELVMTRPWGVVLEILKHEMAHQYVHEILGRTDETAHGASFQAVCAKLGIDATASGLPHETEARGREAADSAEAKLLQRVARLLALAESSNLHEAEAAMKEAQRLLLKHNLDAGRARTGHAAGAPGHAGATDRARRSYSFRHLGAVRARVDESARLVAMILGRHFFVEAIWVQSYDAAAGRRGSVLEICGSVDNLELAAYVHDFLHAAGERLWAEHKRRTGLRLDGERRTYLAGVMLGFAERLSQQEEAQRTEGLVWRGDADLDTFFRRRHPHIRRVYQKGQPRSEARQEGQRAGRELVLHRPLRAPSSGHSAGQTPSAPKALPPARR